MTTLIHVSASVYADLGLVMLRVDTSGDLAPGDVVSLGRRNVDSAVVEDVVVPAGYLSPSGDVHLVNGSGLFADTTVPLDTPVEYLAALPGQSMAVVAGPVTVDSGLNWRLGDPFRPYLDMPLILARSNPVLCPPTDRAALILSLSEDNLDGQGEMTQIPGRADPVVSVEPIATPTFEVRLATRTRVDRDAALALFASGDVLLLRPPGIYETDPRFVEVTGVRVARISSDHRRSWRTITVSAREVAQPAGSAYGWLGARWTDLCGGTYPTWSAMAAAGISWGSLGAGVAGGGLPAAMRTWTEVSASWATWDDLTATGKTWAQVLAGA